MNGENTICDYNNGLNDAWDVIKYLANMGLKTRRELFKYDNVYAIIEHFQPQEVIDKVVKYKEYIEAGDEIKYLSTGRKAIVSYMDEDVVRTIDSMGIMRYYDDTAALCKVARKTGKRYSMWNAIAIELNEED